jgi:TonB family protein
MRYLTLALVILAAGCTITRPTTLIDTGSRYADKYKDQIDPSETFLITGYHYVKTKTVDGRYVLRVFFPETKQMTLEESYADRDLQIRQGPATYWFDNGNLQSSGEYVQGKSEGQWKKYDFASGKLSAVGNYSKGRKSGRWLEYGKGETLRGEYNYESGKKNGPFYQYDSLGNITREGVYKDGDILWQKPEDSITSDSIVEVLPYMATCRSKKDGQARSACSDKALLTYVYSQLNYPADAREYGIEGSALVSFVIDTLGKVQDVTVMKGLCQSITNECEKVVRGLPLWEPGRQQGRKVKVQFKLPIRFKLE